MPGTEYLEPLDQLTYIFQKAVQNKAPDKLAPRVEVVQGNE